MPPFISFGEFGKLVIVLFHLFYDEATAESSICSGKARTIV